MTNTDDDVRNRILEEISAISGRAKPGPVPEREGLEGGAYRVKHPASKVALTVRLNSAALNQFRALKMDLQMTQDALMAEALNLLFKKYGQPPIA